MKTMPRANVACATASGFRQGRDRRGGHGRARPMEEEAGLRRGGWMMKLALGRVAGPSAAVALASLASLFSQHRDGLLQGCKVGDGALRDALRATATATDPAQHEP